MTSDQHLLTLASAVATDIPILLWGPPGIGKTATIQGLARALNVALEVVLASIREPADFSGLPVIDHAGDGVNVSMAPPSWAKRLTEACARADGVSTLKGTKPKAILFLDEISTAPPAVQAALLRVVLDRVVGDMELPQGVAIIAAANPPEQAAGGWELSPPLANRFAHLEWPKPATDVWTNGLISGWPDASIPIIGDWRQQHPLAKGLVSSFLHSRPTALHQLPQDASQQGKAWPSPRSWEMAAKLLAAGLTVTKDEGALSALVGSAVGMQYGLEFAALIGGDLLPNPEEMLKDPNKAELPERADKLLVALNAVVASVADNLTAERWSSAWRLLSRSAEERPRDVAAVAAKSLSQLWELQFKTPKLVLPVPEQDWKPFIPLLKAAGLNV